LASDDRFLEGVEAGIHEPVVGGHAERFVGSDQDEKKMNLEDIFRKYG
jgi:hypothetical protein